MSSCQKIGLNKIKYVYNKYYRNLYILYIEAKVSIILVEYSSFRIRIRFVIGGGQIITIDIERIESNLQKIHREDEMKNKKCWSILWICNTIYIYIYIHN